MDIPADNLRRAAEIKEQIDQLNQELDGILSGSTPAKSTTTRRKPGRPAAKKPGRPAGSGKKPGRPAAKKPGRPAGSGKKPGRPAGSGKKPGRPAGSGKKPGRPPKAATASSTDAAPKKRGRPAKKSVAAADSTPKKRGPKPGTRSSPLKGKKRPKSPSGPLGDAVIKVLQRSNDPMSVAEIHDGLNEDGYVFTAKDPRKNLYARIHTLKGVKRVAPGRFALEK